MDGEETFLFVYNSLIIKSLVVDLLTKIVNLAKEASLLNVSVV